MTLNPRGSKSTGHRANVPRTLEPRVCFQIHGTQDPRPHESESPGLQSHGAHGRASMTLNPRGCQCTDPGYPGLSLGFQIHRVHEQGRHDSESPRFQIRLAHDRGRRGFESLMFKIHRTQGPDTQDFQSRGFQIHGAQDRGPQDSGSRRYQIQGPQYPGPHESESKGFQINWTQGPGPRTLNP